MNISDLQKMDASAFESIIFRILILGCVTGVINNGC